MSNTGYIIYKKKIGDPYENYSANEVVDDVFVNHWYSVHENRLTH